MSRCHCKEVRRTGTPDPIYTLLRYCITLFAVTIEDMEESRLPEQVRRLNAGDADALHALIVHYHPILMRKASAAFDGALGRRLDPEDVLQHAYINAFQAIRECRFDAPAGFYKWIERIALNELKNQKRALRRQRRDAAREAHSAIHTQGSCPSSRASYLCLAERIAADGTTPSGAFAREELTAVLLGALARLSSEQRTVVRLRFLEGRRVADVAVELGKSDDAVHALCYRALKAMKESLGTVTRFMSGG